MPRGDPQAEVIDACIQAAERVNAHGSPALQSAMRVVLLILGHEIARDMARADTVATLLDQPDRASGISAA